MDRDLQLALACSTGPRATTRLHVSGLLLCLADLLSEAAFRGLMPWAAVRQLIAEVRQDQLAAPDPLAFQAELIAQLRDLRLVLYPQTEMTAEQRSRHRGRAIAALFAVALTRRAYARRPPAAAGNSLRSAVRRLASMVTTSGSGNQPSPADPANHRRRRNMAGFPSLTAVLPGRGCVSANAPNAAAANELSVAAEQRLPVA